MECLKKKLIFITGTPRSGTSLLTKIIDSHPDIALLMENIFGNRRRHWMRAEFWNSSQQLKKELKKTYYQLKEPVVGNKVVTPDVWDAGDIFQFCTSFQSFKIIYIVRDPKEVAFSRLKREPKDFLKVYSIEAQKNILLDFRSRFHTYISSWRQSIENYWKLKDAVEDKIKLVYYEDFCQDFENHIRDIFLFLNIDFSEKVLNWFDLPHHNQNGHLEKNLKYPDTGIITPSVSHEKIPKQLDEALELIKWQYDLWKNRNL
jgi:hypothetical protein